MEKKCECDCHKGGLAEQYSGELRRKIETVEATPCVYCLARHAEPSAELGPVASPAVVVLMPAAWSDDDDHDGKTEPAGFPGFPF